MLPAPVRARWQLALCCPLRPLERNHLLWRARQMGIADSICLTGFVDDAVLLQLHQGTDLFVFPSLYEGYGLPVAEALACGAPVLAADASSLPEIVGPEALFDASRPEAMAAAIERGLTDDAFRAAPAGRRRPGTELVGRRRPRHARGLRPDSRRRPDPARPRPAFICDGRVSQKNAGESRSPLRCHPTAARPAYGTAPSWLPWPSDPTWRSTPSPTGRSAASSSSIAFAERPAGPDRRSSGTGGVRQERRFDGTTAGRRPRRELTDPTGVPVHPLAALEAVEGLEGRFDAVVYVVADDADHTGCLAALRRRQDGVVVAHQATLSELYGHAARSGALADGLAGDDQRRLRRRRAPHRRRERPRSPSRRPAASASSSPATSSPIAIGCC